MTNQELQNMSAEDRQMRLSFGRFDPPLGNYPHSIFPNTIGNLRSILAITNKQAGIWGASPLYDLQGQIYVEAEDSFIEAFEMWRAPLNQQILYARGGYGHAFHMIIDIDCKMSVLTQMDKKWAASDDELYYYNWINYVSEWIEEIGWAYVPLEYEFDLALFVVSQDNLPLHIAFEEHMLRSNERLSHLERSSNRFLWSGPTQFKDKEP